MEITAIMAAYNSEDFMDLMINSILKQTYSDFELIIVDDGSSDESHNIAKDYANRYENISSYRIEHAGPSSARNYGLSKARGEYLVFLDSDDEICEDYFETLLDGIKSQNADVVCCGYESVAVGSNKQRRLGRKILTNKVYSLKHIDIKEKYELFSAFTGSCWNKMYRKDFLDRNDIHFPPYEPGMPGEDAYFNFKVMEYAQRIVTVQYVGYKVYKREKDLFLEKYKEKWGKNSLEVIANSLAEIEVIFNASNNDGGKKICKNILDQDVHVLIFEEFCKRGKLNTKRQKLQEYYETEWMQEKIRTYGTDSKNIIVQQFYNGNIAAVMKYRLWLLGEDRIKSLLRPIVSRCRNVIRRVQ